MRWNCVKVGTTIYITCQMWTTVSVSCLHKRLLDLSFTKWKGNMFCSCASHSMLLWLQCLALLKAVINSKFRLFLFDWQRFPTMFFLCTNLVMLLVVQWEQETLCYDKFSTAIHVNLAMAWRRLVLFHEWHWVFKILNMLLIEWIWQMCRTLDCLSASCTKLAVTAVALPMFSSFLVSFSLDHDDQPCHHAACSFWHSVFNRFLELRNETNAIWKQIWKTDFVKDSLWYQSFIAVRYWFYHLWLVCAFLLVDKLFRTLLAS